MLLESCPIQLTYFLAAGCDKTASDNNNNNNTTTIIINNNNKRHNFYIFFILLTHEGPHREVYRDFQPIWQCGQVVPTKELFKLQIPGTSTDPAYQNGWKAWKSFFRTYNLESKIEAFFQGASSGRSEGDPRLNRLWTSSAPGAGKGLFRPHQR